MATLLGLYGATGWVIIVVAVALDYAIRVFMPSQLVRRNGGARD